MDFHLHQGELKLDISGSSVTDPSVILNLAPIADWIDRATKPADEEPDPNPPDGNPPPPNENAPAQ